MWASRRLLCEKKGACDTCFKDKPKIPGRKHNVGAEGLVRSKDGVSSGCIKDTCSEKLFFSFSVFLAFLFLLFLFFLFFSFFPLLPPFFFFLLSLFLVLKCVSSFFLFFPFFPFCTVLTLQSWRL